MMQLRVVCDRSHSAAVRELLESRSGIVHLTQFPGAAVSPPGDVFEVLVAREAVQHVVDALVGEGIDQRGEISVQAIDLTVSQTADAAVAAVPREGGDVIVWDELLETTGEDSDFSLTFLAFLTVGCLLAAIGVITDSAVLIVGAMVVSPDFGPLAALGVSVVGRRRDLAVRAGLALGAGFPAAILITALCAVVARAAGILDAGSLTDLGDVAFVYQVGPYSVIVALLAGAAGMLALTSQKSGALVGVFISITTVPSAGFAALAAVTGEWHRSGEAMLQLLTNMAGVVVAAVVTLWFRRHSVSSHPSRPRRYRAR